MQHRVALGIQREPAVEYCRAEGEENSVQRFLAESFWDWGIPTVASLTEIAQSVMIPVIASGGVRSGTDMAKALALNACLASVSQPVLQAAVKGSKNTGITLMCMIEELRNVMFLVGAEKVEQLTKTPIVITGRTAEWLETRGFNVDKYARRGAR